jgi:hypothetical protein
MSVYRVPRSMDRIKKINSPFQLHGIIWSGFLMVIYEFLAVVSLVFNVFSLLPGAALLIRYRSTDRKLTWKHLRFDSVMIFVFFPFTVRSCRIPLLCLRRLPTTWGFFCSQILSVILLPLHLIMSLFARPDVAFLDNHLVNALKRLSGLDMHPLFKYAFLWVIVLVELFLVGLILASHFFAFISTPYMCAIAAQFHSLIASCADFFALCLLCLVSPLWADQTIRKKIIVAMWVLTSPLFGLLQFMVLHLPRIIASPTMFATTIFQLCTSQARNLEGCVDFYSSNVVPNIAWGWIWAFWVLSYLYSWSILFPWMAKYIWSYTKQAK